MIKVKASILLFSAICFFGILGCKNSINTSKTLRINVSSEPDSFDPYVSEAADTRAICFNIFEGLMSFNEDGKIIPGLAKSVDISSDGLTYTFELQSDVTFHNGQKFTSEDVLFSYNKYTGLLDGKPSSGKFSMIKSIKAVDEDTFAITLKKANPGFLSIVAFTFITPKDYLDNAQKPIGTGPFVFEDYTLHQKVVLSKNNNYWNKEALQQANPKANIEKVEIYIMSDETSSIAALQSKQLDIAQMIEGGNAKKLEKKYTVVSNAQNMEQIFAMNTALEPFNDIRVRQAICHAIDRNQIIAGVADGFASPVYSNFSPVLKEYYNDELEHVYDYDIQKAKNLLKEAGYENGFTTTVSVPSNYQFHVNTAVIIAEQLKQIGINLKIVNLEWATWLDRVYLNADYETTIVAFDGKLDPAQILSRYESSFQNNFMHYHSAIFDSTLHQAQSENDYEKRVALYKECQKILTLDAPAAFICDPNNVVLLQKNVKGYTNYPIVFYDFSKIYFEQ